MAQHILLSSRARKLSLMQIAKMSDNEALKAFADIRWHSNGGVCIVAMQTKFILSLQEMSINVTSVIRDLA